MIRRDRTSSGVAHVALALTALALWGCPQQQSEEPDGWQVDGDNNTAANNSSAANNGTPNNGAPDDPVMADYAAQCAACHGVAGEGGVGPALQGWPDGRDELVRVIDETMPTGDPSTCAGECAEAMADLILERFTASTCASDEVAYAPRRLRLLNRREYDNTIRDLFAPYLGLDASGEPMRACGDVTACELGQEQCSGGVCQDLPCDVATFIYDPGGRQASSVHVAGSFNGWPASAAEGGLAMTYHDALGVWYAESQLTEGRHTYKFVVDGDWIQDPGNPDSEDDGYGGRNSVVTISCEATQPGPDTSGFDRDWSQGLPNEQREEYFEFDNNADTLFVSSAHLATYLANGEALAEIVTGRVDDFVSCDWRGDEAGCAEQFVREFGERAFRRPLTEAQVTRYAEHITSQPDFEAGLSVAVRVMLSSPYFLYRSELGEDRGDGTYALTPWEMASAMSYLYWGTMPDDALFEAARRGQLSTPEQIEAQAERLLDDPRARPILGDFAEQWLGIEKIATKPKNQTMFPDFDEPLRRAMLDETRHFFTELALSPEGRFEDLFTADYSYVNDRLASHYGIAGPGAELGRVEMPAERRAGVLSQASVLAAYSHSDQTSPILRGLFVRTHLLCQEFPPPPANVGVVPDVDPNATTRERFAQHSTDPSCAGCHVLIDEVGFGFEHFDPVGRWRADENGEPIDASGELVDAKQIGLSDGGFDELGELGRLLGESDRTRECMTRQVWRFGLGYKEGAAEKCAIERLEADFAAGGYTIRDLLLALPQQESFRVRR